MNRPEKKYKRMREILEKIGHYKLTNNVGKQRMFNLIAREEQNEMPVAPKI